MNGKVLWFDIRDGRGIIVDTAGNEYYTDVSVGPADLKPNEAVSFDLNLNITCTACAMNVKRNNNE